VLSNPDSVRRGRLDVLNAGKWPARRAERGAGAAKVAPMMGGRGEAVPRRLAGLATEDSHSGKQKRSILDR
jgi:hypothetical protein